VKGDEGSILSRSLGSEESGPPPTSFCKQVSFFDQAVPCLTVSILVCKYLFIPRYNNSPFIV